MSEPATVATETEILEQVIEPNATGMSAEAAKARLGFRFNESAIVRINELAEKNRQ
jgi:hypothetical protein